MARYAENTDVPSSQTQEEIERILRRYGATQFLKGWDENKALIGFVYNGKQVRFMLPLPDRKSDQIRKTPERGSVRSTAAQERAYEQAVRQKWRALALVVKAKLEAVEAGISIFEREFFYDIVLPNGKTVGEQLLPQVEESYRTGTIPALMPFTKE